MKAALHLLEEKVERASRWREKTEDQIFLGHTMEERRKILFANSDASGSHVAGVRWEQNGKERKTVLMFSRPLTEQERRLHINAAETLAGIELLQAIHPWAKSTATVVVEGLDNKKAVRAICMGFFPGEDRLSNKIWDALMLYENTQVYVYPMWVPGVLQVADEGTRGRQDVYETTNDKKFRQKAEKCWAFMQLEVEDRQEKEMRLREIDIAWRGRKREREENQ